jgi:hypothetical protein
MALPLLLLILGSYVADCFARWFAKNDLKGRLQFTRVIAGRFSNNTPRFFVSP